MDALVPPKVSSKNAQNARSAVITLKRIRAATRILWRFQALSGESTTSGFRASLISEATVAEIVESLLTAVS